MTEIRYALLRGAARSERVLHLLAFFISFCTVVLLCAGALVTSTGSGLAVPDWPLSFGQFFPRMEGGVLFEHGHRLVAGTVATLITLYAVFVHLSEDGLLKRLSRWAVAMVLAQALLGGMTVLFKLPTAVSVAHACLAQLFFCVVCTIALVTSRFWTEAVRDHSVLGRRLAVYSKVMAGAFFVQLLLGAIMRHRGAGLAVPDFPLVFGGFWPPVVNFSILVHLAHRTWAFVVIGMVAVFAMTIYRKLPSRLDLQAYVGALLALLSFQVLLGAFTIWMRKPVVLTMLHLAIGASCLATAVTMAVYCNRIFRRA
ncbi:MAG: COX15/CtaA family protein [Deltaproteobacteria bacterium]|nr:COX15/CtaA family protein [Deltaproteobacteria bacterium]